MSFHEAFALFTCGAFCGACGLAFLLLFWSDNRV